MTTVTKNTPKAQSCPANRGNSTPTIDHKRPRDGARALRLDAGTVSADLDAGELSGDLSRAAGEVLDDIGASPRARGCRAWGFIKDRKFAKGERGATDGGLGQVASGDQAVAALTSWTRARA